MKDVDSRTLCRPLPALTLAIAILPAVAGAPVSRAAAEDDGDPAAWFRVQENTSHAQEYQGVSYVWLGATALRIVIDVKPSPGQVLELAWGSKNDIRQATLFVGDKEIELRHGGYDGFRPFAVPLPKDVTGERYEIKLVATGQEAAFLAGFRLLAPAKGRDPAAGKADSSAHKMRLEPIAAPRPEAFPEMRALWDGEPAPSVSPLTDARLEAAFRQAEINGRRAHEQFYRCRRFVDGWLAQADPVTGLIPRNLNRDRGIWNAQDSAADNYPFMVLTAAITDRPLFEGRMHDMLRTETRLTSRLDRLPDTWSFSKQDFHDSQPNVARIIFGSSEYVKDGLLPLTEWLGTSPWSERMIGIVDDIWKHAPVDTKYGRIPSTNVEVNGEMLQALSRVYWFTGERKYLEWASRLGDYYLLGGHHPTRDFDSLRLRDHGCEIVSGLAELYVAVHFADPKRKKRYEEPVHAMFDRILEIGRDERGMLYNTIHPKKGTYDKGICDTWGYNYNGIYSVFLIDGTQAYRDAVRHVLSNLEAHVISYHWGSADEYADSIEGAINLYNREPDASAARWIDSEIRDMWSVQRRDGVVEGWHGDGNSARTAIMYALWKTQGFTVRPWTPDIRIGATRDGDAVLVSVVAEKEWSGKLLADRARHRDQLRLPLDYPRINQFPEWFTVEEDGSYTVTNPRGASSAQVRGKELIDGLALELGAGEERRLILRAVNP